MGDVIVKIGSDLPSRPAPGDTGTAFVVATTDRGAVSAPVLVRSTAQLIAAFGPRVAYNPIHDTLKSAFIRGLDHAWVVRRVGPAAATATKNLVNATGENTLEAKAASPGEWANKVEVGIVAGVTEGTFHVHVSENGHLLTNGVSPELVDNAAAVAWAANTGVVTLKDLGKGDPKVQSVTLSGGADDRANVTGSVIASGLDLFTQDLGPGQVAVPGNTAEDVQAAVMTHCAETNRTPFLDGEDTADADDLIEQVGALRSLPGGHQAAVFGPWDIVPGEAQGTFIKVPPVGRQLGAVAAVDSASGTSNLTASGPKRGKDSYPVGLSQTYSPEDQKRLKEAGVNLSVIDEGEVMTNSWRTLADPVTDKTWLPLSSSRQVLAMAAGAAKVLKNYEEDPLDAQEETRAAAEGAVVTEVIQPAFRARAIYGLTEAEAASFTVAQEVSPTDTSIGKLTGTLAIRPTKFADVIEITVVATDEAL